MKTTVSGGINVSGRIGGGGEKKKRKKRNNQIVNIEIRMKY